MRVELGNAAAHEVVGGQPRPLEHGQPAVTTFVIPDDYSHTEGADAIALLRHMNSHPDVTRLPGMEAFVAVVKGWVAHSSAAPTWVASDNPDMQRLLAEYWDIPAGVPADVEDTHHTESGPPGVGPAPAPEPEAAA